MKCSVQFTGSGEKEIKKNRMIPLFILHIITGMAILVLSLMKGDITGAFPADHLLSEKGRIMAVYTETLSGDALSGKPEQNPQQSFYVGDADLSAAPDIQFQGSDMAASGRAASDMAADSPSTELMGSQDAGQYDGQYSGRDAGQYDSDSHGSSQASGSSTDLNSSPSGSMNAGQAEQTENVTAMDLAGLGTELSQSEHDDRQDQMSDLSSSELPSSGQDNSTSGNIDPTSLNNTDGYADLPDGGPGETAAFNDDTRNDKSIKENSFSADSSFSDNSSQNASGAEAGRGDTIKGKQEDAVGTSSKDNSGKMEEETKPEDDPAGAASGKSEDGAEKSSEAETGSLPGAKAESEADNHSGEDSENESENPSEDQSEQTSEEESESEQDLADYFYDYADSITIAELTALDDSHAAAATELTSHSGRASALEFHFASAVSQGSKKFLPAGGPWPESTGRTSAGSAGTVHFFEQTQERAASAPSGLWSFDIYYVNQDDPRHVSRNTDFTLKYQAEFHTSTDLDPASVIIRIPARLLTDRNGNIHYPDEIGVPKGAMVEGGAVLSPDTPFNWYMEEDELVFFNYRYIRSGTNTAFQVLYRGLKLLDIPDGSSWSFPASVSVLLQGRTEREEINAVPLTGDVDSTASLSSVSCRPFTDPSKKYTPALYTKKQLESVLRQKVDSDLAEHAEDYVFVAWEIKSIGNGSQPWELTFSPQCLMNNNSSGQGENSIRQGEIVGICTYVTGTDAGEQTPRLYGTCIRYEDIKDSLPDKMAFSLTSILVAAYPKSQVSDGSTQFSLDLHTVLHPADGLDSDSEDITGSNWTFIDYKWHYDGDVIGIRVYTGQKTEDGKNSYSFSSHVKDEKYPGWIDEYRAIQKLNGSNNNSSGQDQGGGDQSAEAGSFHFRVKGYCRGYERTHSISGADKGAYLPGSCCEVTTVSDAAYLIAQTGSQAGLSSLLTAEDYYFKEVTVTVTDNGIDLYEDEETSAMPSSECPGVDRSLKIYAMFRGKNEWSLAAEVPWEDDGETSYTFPAELTARKPWRIKVVHKSTDYVSRSRIDLTMQADSAGPSFRQQICGGGDVRTDSARVECLGGISGRGIAADQTAGEWMQDTRTDGGTDGSRNYSEPGLVDLTESLYGVILMRDASFVSLTPVGRHAQAVKTASAVNDPEHGQVRLIYTVAAAEGLEIYDESARDRIGIADLSYCRPERTGFAVYDLLPPGVSLDPSVEIIGGLMEGQEESDYTSPSRWNREGVKVRISRKNDIFPNWRGSGRTLLVFHVSFEGNPSLISRFGSDMWFDGYGIRFGASCSYRDLKDMQKEANLAAVMPEKEDISAGRELLAEASEAARDNGVIVPDSEENRSLYQIYGRDINEDGETELLTVLYARAYAAEDTAVGLTSGISKWVRSDRDLYSSYAKEAEAGPGEGYSYRIDLVNESKDPVLNIVIFDHLERAAINRPEAEINMDFDTEFWQGSFAGADLTSARKKGIAPVLYYSLLEDAPKPSAGQDPSDILTEENGWIREDNWEKSLGEVKSIAVDLRYKEDGSRWELTNGDCVRVYLNMTAPSEETEARYAYNSSTFYSEGAESGSAELVESNSVRVRLEKRDTLIVTKESDSSLPEDRKDDVFRFRVLREDKGAQTPCAHMDYALESLKDGEWTGDEIVHATDGEGYFSLGFGERAVFSEAPGAGSLKVEEEADLFYESSLQEMNEDQIRSLTFLNHFRPPLLLRKKCIALPDGVDASGFVFRVHITQDGRSMAGEKAWLVESRAADSFRGRKLGERLIDEDSCISLSPGEVIAIFPGDSGSHYEIQEMPECYGDGTDFIQVVSASEGDLKQTGSLVTLENAWKWKSIFLTKKLLHKKESECQENFSFRIWKRKESSLTEDVPGPEGWNAENLPLYADPVPGLSWVCEELSLNGTSGPDGSFSCPCAGRTLEIMGLIGGCDYFLEEIDIPEDYEALNGGILLCSMPIYSRSFKAEIVNNCRLRDLSVSKFLMSAASEEVSYTASPGYPGRIVSGNEIIELYRHPAEEGLTGYRIEFPCGVRMRGNEYIQFWADAEPVRRIEQSIDPGTGTIEISGNKALTISFKSSNKLSPDGFLLKITVLHEDGDPAGQNSQAGGNSDDTEGTNESGAFSTDFHFSLELADEDGTYRPAAGQAYRLGEEEFFTDDEGGFTLRAGQCAHFPDLAEEGRRYRVSERPDPSCPQTYPADGRPAEGVLGSEADNQLHFINGGAARVLIRKRFSALPDDAAGTAYLDELRKAESGDRLCLISGIMIETDMNGSFQPYEGEVRVIGSSSGIRSAYPSGGVIWLSENETAVISSLADGINVRCRELDSNVCLRKQEDGSCVFFSFSKISPSEEWAQCLIGGAPSEITFENQICMASSDGSSLVRKGLLDGDEGWERIPDGAVLTFLLERYSSGRWQAAADVPWIQSDLKDTVGLKVSRTGPDGLISIKKHDGDWQGYDSDNAYLQPLVIGRGQVRTAGWYEEHEAAEGSLRISELYEKSDPSYGILSFSSENYFWNTNAKRTLIVEKTADEDTGTEFRMVLSRLEDKGKTVPAAGVFYRVYESRKLEDGYTDTGTGQGILLAEGKTGEDGSFSLRAGTYALFELPAGFRWRVEENNKLPWRLESTSSSYEIPGAVRRDNGVELTLEEVVTDGALNTGMLDELYDLESGEKLDMSGENVVIPHYVRFHGHILEITHIDNLCFSGNDRIRSLTISEGIESIAGSFEDCSLLTSVSLPHSLKSIGEYAFAGDSLHSVDIWENVDNIGDGCFADPLEGDVVVRIHQKKGKFDDVDWTGALVSYVG